MDYSHPPAADNIPPAEWIFPFFPLVICMNIFEYKE